MNGKDANGGGKSIALGAISQTGHIGNMSDDLSAIQQFKIIAG
jgi:hypothetical protein